MQTFDLNVLSEPQRQIYDLLVKGKTPEQIANKTGMTLGVVKAQMTRMTGKGITFAGETAPSASPVTHVNPKEAFRPSAERPSSTGSSSNEAIAKTLMDSAPAMTAKQLEELASRAGGPVARDVHPMIVLGCTMQFVRLCGGRMTAHQVIEDVYCSLREFMGTKPVPEDQGETRPMPQSDADRLRFLEEQNAQMQEEIRRLKERR